MRLAIVGSRQFRPMSLVHDFVQSLKPETVVVSGGALGVDCIAELAAMKRGLVTDIFPADWDRLGKRAGFIRNQEMIATVQGVVAFWDGKSPGTKHAIELAIDAKLWIRVYGSQGQLLMKSDHLPSE